jgi:hypothetical protein
MKDILMRDDPHPDAELLDAWAVYQDQARLDDHEGALRTLTGRPAVTLRGAAAQAAVLAELIGADDPDPDATQLLAAQLRDAMERQIEEELRRLADLKAELARLAAQTGAELDGPGAS